MRLWCALFLLVPVLCVAFAAQTTETALRVRGDDTLILAAQRCSSLYNIDNPKVRIKFDVAGEGAARGFSLLETGQAEIAQAKNAQRGPELDRNGRKILRIPVAIESIVVYVNASNSVKALSIADLKAIFTGQITNWRQLGGSDHRINLYSGESTGGVNDYFQESVLDGAEADNFWGKATTRELIESVSHDKDAIGYSSLCATAKGVHLVSIRKVKGTAAIEPNGDTIRKHTYPLTRTVYWYVAEHPSGSLRDFLNWIYQPHGQLVFESVGFFPLMPDDRRAGLATLDGKTTVRAR